MVEDGAWADREEAMRRSPQGMAQASAVHGDLGRLMSIGLLLRPQRWAVRP